MDSRREARPEGGSDERAGDEGRLTVERAEEVWQRQTEDEGAAAPVAPLLRIVLLALAMLAIVFLLFQRLAQIG